MTIQTVGHFTTEDPALDTDLDDLKIVDLGGTLTLFAASGQNGGLSSWSIGSTGAASLVDSVVFNPGWTLGMASDVEIVARPGGGYEVLVGSASSGVLTGYAATTAGQINAATSWSGLGTSLSRITDYEDTVAGLALADTAGRLGFLTRNANGSVASVNLIADSDATHLAHVSTLASTTVGGATILIAGDAGEDGLTSFVIGPGGPVVANTIGPNDGLGIMDPTGIEFVTLLGQTYAIVASAQGEAGMLTVLHVSSSGEMTRTDEVFDDLGTRFGGVQAIATVELGGQVFVGAGGADDGFSLFVLLPGGQLQHLETIENTWTTGVAGQAALADVTAMVAAESGGKLRFFIASGEAGGVTQLGYEPGAAGVQMIAPSTGATLTGGASNDLLVGGTGDDTITGGSGNDIIVDGAGIDTLSGGSGADTFVLRHDGAQDTILDFNPTQDKLDLSHWVFFYDPASLGVTSTATGALVTFRSETLILNSATGGSITAAQVRAAVIDNPKHGIDFTTFTMPPPSPPEPEPEPEPEPDPLPPPDPDPIPDPTPGPDPSPTPDPTPPPPPPPVSVPEPPARNYDIKDTARSDKIYGTSRSESIRISYGSDTVKAYSGHDLVEGGYGKNSIWLGKGNDRFNDLGQSGAWDGDKIYGESGNDVIIAGAGNDYIDGGSGKDRLYGGGGHDRLYGRTSSDHLDGGSGNDRLYGHSGNDRLYGGTEDDYLSGSTGSDRLYGGAGNDVLKGGSSKDKLYGEDGNDRLYGGSSADTLYGGNGDDYLDGSTSSDKLYGGAGNDVLKGGSSKDNLYGNSGNDRLYGGSSADTLYGGDGNDYLDGSTSSDKLYGGAGNDVLKGGSSKDKLYGEDGNDRLYGGSSADTLYGGNGDDYLDGSTSSDKLYGGAGDDTLKGGSSKDTLYGNSGNDRLYGGTSSDKLYGGDGKDILYGESGNDVIKGGAGADVISGGTGNDKIYGEDGDDRIYAGSGNDYISSGRGNDRITGGSNGDEFHFYRYTGNDVITDFSMSDEIVLHGISKKTVSISVLDGDTVISFGSDSVILEDFIDKSFDIKDLSFVS